MGGLRLRSGRGKSALLQSANDCILLECMCSFTSDRFEQCPPERAARRFGLGDLLFVLLLIGVPTLFWS